MMKAVRGCDLQNALGEALGLSPDNLDFVIEAPLDGLATLTTRRPLSPAEADLITAVLTQYVLVARPEPPEFPLLPDPRCA